MRRELENFALDVARNLPREIVLFPLSHAILLPNGRLPLHVFQEHTLALLNDALASRGRLIGMIQPQHQEDNETDTRIPLSRHSESTLDLFEVGCAGRVVKFSESTQGRSWIVLYGISRFVCQKIALTPANFLRATVSWDDYPCDLKSFRNGVHGTRKHERLLKHVQVYCNSHEVQADFSVLRQLPFDDLVRTLAMSLPFSILEKQALLEAKNLEALLTTLETLIAIGSGDEGSRGLQ